MQKLYTLVEVAKELNLPKETFRNWTTQRPGATTTFYDPPEPVAVTGRNMLLWDEEQVALMKVEIVQALSDRRAWRQAKAHRAREAKARIHQQKLRKKEALEKELAKTETAIEKLDRERAERALEWLTKK
jgi:hypothetical protein